MRIGVLGSAAVGQRLGSAWVRKGHEVRLGSRRADNGRARVWADALGARASHGTFVDAAAFGEVVVNCTAGEHSEAALTGCELAGKVLLDVANPLRFEKGEPVLTVCNDDSLAERIQRAHPGARVVKALNTVNVDVMVDPGRIPGDHEAFVCGDDAAAKDVVVGLLRELGWRSHRDLGGLVAARALEMYLPLWVRLFRELGTARFNLRIVTGS